MKTAKLYISILLIAITTSAFGIHHMLSEDETVVEDWMTIPFETPASENPVLLEDWMTTPFESIIIEEKLEMEDWMRVPMWS